MSEYPLYPGSAPTPQQPSARYVVVVTGTANQGMFAPDPLIGPMSQEEALAVMARIAAGDTSAVVGGSIDLISEVEPGHLVLHKRGLLGPGVNYVVRLAKVLVEH